MSLTILSVAYPLAPVSIDASGGAEQILAILDRAIVAAGHRSIVVAPEGSRVSGTLLPIAPPTGTLDEPAKAAAQRDTGAAIDAARRRWPVDLVHLHGIDFAAYLPVPGVPVLATLHLPPAWYPPEALRPVRPDTWLHCVSEAQHRDCPPSPNRLAPITNGVDVAALRARHAKRRYALFLGRICPEKGVHLAIEAARAAEIPLLIAGELFPYEAHTRYFDECVRPNLGAACRYLGPVGFARKRRLLSAAGCVLIPSTAPETSSLVAREAAACGTPVVALRNGALVEAVEDGRTGFLVSDVPEMALAIGRCGGIDAQVCRDAATTRFSQDTMIARYLDLYRQLAGRQAVAS